MECFSCGGSVKMADKRIWCQECGTTWLAVSSDRPYHQVVARAARKILKKNKGKPLTEGELVIAILAKPGKVLRAHLEAKEKANSAFHADDSILSALVVAARKGLLTRTLPEVVSPQYSLPKKK